MPSLRAADHVGSIVSTRCISHSPCSQYVHKHKSSISYGDRTSRAVSRPSNRGTEKSDISGPFQTSRKVAQEVHTHTDEPHHRKTEGRPEQSLEIELEASESAPVPEPSVTAEISIAGGSRRRYARRDAARTCCLSLSSVVSKLTAFSIHVPLMGTTILPL